MAASLARVLPRLISQNVINKVPLYSSDLFKNVTRFTPLRWTAAANISTSSSRNGLMEFFDNRDNWGETLVTVGRPWRHDELRLKSNSDLHKLWYVLLKERNMILTMEAEHARQFELMPSPERLEKVEESMENLLDVVQERNRAYNLLETGEAGEPGRRWAYNHLGIGFWKKCKEHFKPIHMSTKNNFHGQWQNAFIRLWREKKFNERARERKVVHAKVKFIENFHPHLRGSLKEDISSQDSKLTNEMRGPDYNKKN